jgi:hypothetical protein
MHNCLVKLVCFIVRIRFMLYKSVLCWMKDESRFPMENVHYPPGDGVPRIPRLPLLTRVLWGPPSFLLPILSSSLALQNPQLPHATGQPLPV